MAAPAVAVARGRDITTGIANPGRWLPSHADLFLAAMIVWLFAQAPGWGRLMLDGDTGWHIRTGEWILQHRAVPYQDLFSFTRPGASWFAWEWLSDVLFATLHQAFGLPGVAAVCGLAIVLSAGILLRLMASMGFNTFAALILAVMSVGASSVHYLARPHVFTMLFLSISVSMVWSDLKNRTNRIWLLAPLTALWTNLHGGFLVLIALLALTAAGLAIEAFRGSRPWADARRYAVLTAACAAASLCNPYGPQLHSHIADYLRSGYINSAVQEFQSPSFRSESMLQFELLLFAGLASCGLAAMRGQWALILPVVYMGHASLASARHIPLFVIVALPLIAREITVLWDAWVRNQGPRSTAKVLNDVASDAGRQLGRFTLWAAPLVALAVLLTPADQWPTDFSTKHFPQKMVQKHAEMLSVSRLFTSDQWGDYLIYHLYPKVRVYMDGRSDFYGEGMGREYLAMIQLQAGWQKHLVKNQFDTVLADPEWPLVAGLRLDPSWRVADEDSSAILFVRAQSK